MKKITTVYDLNGVPTTHEYELADDYFYDIIDGQKILKEQLEPVKINGQYLLSSGWPIYHEDFGHCGLCGKRGMKGCCNCQGGS
jgi:hypothetical protein